MVTYSIPVKVGWNLLSLPVEISGATKEMLFPTAVSDAYLYEDGYVVADVLEMGRGFLIKFGSAETIQVTGIARYGRILDLRPGWNILGSVTDTAMVRSIQLNPPGITKSRYFGFDPEFGYSFAETLSPGTGFWVKVSQWGTISIHSHCPGNPSVVHDGKTYNTIRIGDRCWLKENLDIGTMIQGTDTSTDNGTIEKYCVYDDTANCAVYGGLYQWDEAMAYSPMEGAQGICPPGWHIPTIEEFDTLLSRVDGNGNALKAVGQGTGEGMGTNTSGFSAILAGFRDFQGLFYPGYHVAIWSSSEYNALTVYYMDLYCDYSETYLYEDYKDYGFSVRCIEN